MSLLFYFDLKLNFNILVTISDEFVAVPHKCQFNLVINCNMTTHLVICSVSVKTEDETLWHETFYFKSL